ncbi:hypothetical protein Sta7437_1822 [Stanieria cyanosphaera PCC 7437]|uniref:Uncharacterized protein n=1 Tax=Stanieria cyanosphaera (strain ATCC 29371 / PCC 7437) TaxID=111780 RepID=K9XRZ6_STAC7|nr:hypothetical protein [Stanieria cyanosphaera]AFZ35380.1 hypothetical protein Sta7437_1822 [Stanieria cyanosphaera PCC 7437]
MFTLPKLVHQPIVWFSILILTAIAIEIISKPFYLSDSPPQLEFPFLIKTLILLIWSFCLVATVRKNVFKTLGYAPPKFKAYQLGLIGFTAIISWFFLGLFLINPQQFSLLALEDQIIENASAFLCFASAFILAIALVNIFSLPPSRSRFFKLIMLGILSLVIFVIGMEEVSWFQRMLAIKTPASFSNNLQQEMNLHNFATNKFEYIYYLGTFSLFSIVPLIKPLFQKYQWYSSINLLLPGSFTFHVGAIAAAYNYDMWDFPLIQVAFGIAFFGMVFYAFEKANTTLKILQIIVIVVMAMSQIMFIFKGNAFLRLYDVTEYKEFFIALTMFVYAIEVLANVRKLNLKKNENLWFLN